MPEIYAALSRCVLSTLNALERAELLKADGPIRDLRFGLTLWYQGCGPRATYTLFMSRVPFDPLVGY